MTLHYNLDTGQKLAYAWPPVAAFFGLCYALYCFYCVSRIPINPKQKAPPSAVEIAKRNEANPSSEDTQKLKVTEVQNGVVEQFDNDGHGNEDTSDERIFKIYQLIRNGAIRFLVAEYKYLLLYMLCMFILIIVTIGASVNDFKVSALTGACFILGAFTSISAAFIGMMIATYSNGRTTISARQSLAKAFDIALRGGSVMGFCLVSLGILSLYTISSLYFWLWLPNQYKDHSTMKFSSSLGTVARAISGFGIGASSVSLFLRVGGGIFTKAADVGADLVGKIEHNIPEDDPRNPAVIADNVGDNVGDIAGMGADLFGSFVGATASSFVLASEIEGIYENASENNGNVAVVHIMPLLFGLCIMASGVFSCMISSSILHLVYKVEEKNQIKKFLNIHQFISTIIAAGIVTLFAYLAFGTKEYSFKAPGVQSKVILFTWKEVIGCVYIGLAGGWIIGYITEFFTGSSYLPVRQIAAACRTGAATNIIYGLSLGYFSTGVPIIVDAILIYGSMHMAGMYGIALTTLGVLCTLATSLSIDAFGPIADNAGGIAEMSHLEPYVRERTDTLDATGNTTAAIGKGFAVCAACLVGIAEVGTFQYSVCSAQGSSCYLFWLVDELILAGLLIGAMQPYIFSALCLRAVGATALDMVEEVRAQFQNEDIRTGKVPPDYDKCILISTEASLKHMILPGCIVILSPLFYGFIFGARLLCGVVLGVILSCVLLSISSSNSGGAWDNAKKYIESGLLQGCSGKGTEEHKAAVIGDTVGDPLKDTSGPSLNIMIKLLGIIPIVFASAFMQSADNSYVGVFRGAE